MKITNIHRDLAKVLLMCINNDKEQALITYKDMCNRANNIINPRTSSGYLGDLSLLCYENNMPLISVMVVNSDTYMPGSGFFRLYKDLTGNEIDDEFSIFKEQLNKVRDYDNWDSFAKLLDLDIKMSSYEKNRTSQDTAISDKKLYKEGKLKLEIHIKRERNPKVVKEAKKLFINKNKRLYCELCGFDFEEVYGELGKNFIEGHHIKPISDMDEGDITNVKDIKMLCSNCHRMVHRGIERGIDLDEIKSIMK